MIPDDEVVYVEEPKLEVVDARYEKTIKLGGVTAKVTWLEGTQTPVQVDFIQNGRIALSLGDNQFEQFGSMWTAIEALRNAKPEEANDESE